jgi:hypothetical protein
VNTIEQGKMVRTLNYSLKHRVVSVLQTGNSGESSKRLHACRVFTRGGASATSL